MNENNPIIFAYSRKDAIADGVLVDVSNTARKAGFLLPIAVTSAVWGGCVAVPPGVSGQDEVERLWNVLNMLFIAVWLKKWSGSEIRYRLHVRNDNADGPPPLVELKAVGGHDDDGSPCVTIMFPDED
jgi:hypothetical protein